MVAHHEMLGQGVQGRQKAARVIAHDLAPLGAGAVRVGAREISDKALIGAAGELRQPVGQIVMRVAVDVARGGRRLRHLAIIRVGVGARMGRVDALHPGMHLGHAAEHAIEGGVFHHQHDDVLDRRGRRRH